MSRIDDLLAELCPNGVEFKALGEVGSFIRGSGLQKKDFTETGVGCVHYGEIYTYYGTSTSSTKSFISPDLAKRLKKATRGDLVVTTTSENVEDVCKAVAWLGGQEIAIGGHSCVYRHDLDPLFIAYYFQSEAFQTQKRKFVAGTKVKDIRLTDLARIRVPVPPIDVQRAIAEVLERMEQMEAELKAELKAELEARTRQCEHYRDELIASCPGVAWTPVGDIATLKYGYTAKAAERGDHRFIRITDIDRNGKLLPTNAKYVQSAPAAEEYLVKAGDLLMARTGATYGKTMLATEDMDAVYASFLIRIRCDHSRVLPAYYWHFAQSSLFWRQADALASSGGQPQFNGNALKQVEIPIPPVEEQKRIVDVLDRFDAVANQLSLDLSAEILARRKQYGYYRDFLLTLPERTA